MPAETVAPSAAARAPVVVITGGSAGVGRATAELFAEEGWDVALLARGEDRLEDACDAIEALGARALAVPCDGSDAAAVFAAAERIERELGPIDCWVNDAMVTQFARFQDMTPAEFKRVVDVTLMGQVYGTMAALKVMQARDRGTIVCVGSALAYRGIPLQTAYCAAKHGIRGFLDGLRSELIHDGSGIRLSTVHLPGLNTPQFHWARNRLDREPRPVPPVYDPKVAAAAILRAAREAPRELWVGASTLKIVLGSMVAPGLLDSLLANQAFSGQKDDIAARDRPDNLFEAAPGVFAARGRFADEARQTAVTVDGERVRKGIGMAAAALVAGAAAWAVARRR
ncbi:SDR family oxidoreductase [Caenispirillum bisanense]|uniref:NADP-dependent 3-hydroxy acid dehydrogenase YdfG n=1 Tax=Caenispirillum bisanense TaxID=414052 RepID=A0A286GY76_9PROT|nr:SDR family oxidoreductase [Caenispirillum bisanense]SOE00441.1 NADP-dependent 3-hydroxy acid dehydrogenase YdfG [Caenispirillum bisanense]